MEKAVPRRRQWLKRKLLTLSLQLRGVKDVCLQAPLTVQFRPVGGQMPIGAQMSLWKPLVQLLTLQGGGE